MRRDLCAAVWLLAAACGSPVASADIPYCLTARGAEAQGNAVVLTTPDCRCVPRGGCDTPVAGTCWLRAVFTDAAQAPLDPPLVRSAVRAGDPGSGWECAWQYSLPPTVEAQENDAARAEATVCCIHDYAGR